MLGMGIDLIAPSLPAITHSLNVSESFSKNLISLYLLGYAIGNFCIGFLSDAWGRRKLLLAGLFFFVLASLLPPFFHHPSILLLARILQGIGLGAFAVISRAIFSDILPQKRLMRTGILIATMWGLGPIIGPIIGGYLQFYINWQACFFFYAGMGLVSLLTFFFLLPETHLNRTPLHFKKIAGNIKTITSHRIFIGLTLLMGMAYSLLISFNTLGPFLIQNSLGFSSITFGHIALCMGLFFLTGTMLCRYLIQKHTPEQLFQIFIPIVMSIAGFSVLLSYFESHSLTLIILISLFMFLGSGIFFPAAMGKGLACFRHMSGSATAVMNSGNLLVASLGSALASLVHLNSMIPLAWIYLSLAVTSWIIYWFLIRPPLEEEAAPEASP